MVKISQLILANNHGIIVEYLKFLEGVIQKNVTMSKLENRNIWSVSNYLHSSGHLRRLIFPWFRFPSANFPHPLLRHVRLPGRHFCMPDVRQFGHCGQENSHRRHFRPDFWQFEAGMLRQPNASQPVEKTKNWMQQLFYNIVSFKVCSSYCRWNGKDNPS